MLSYLNHFEFIEIFATQCCSLHINDVKLMTSLVARLGILAQVTDKLSFCRRKLQTQTPVPSTTTTTLTPTPTLTSLTLRRDAGHRRNKSRSKWRPDFQSKSMSPNQHFLSDLIQAKARDRAQIQAPGAQEDNRELNFPPKPLGLNCYSYNQAKK